MTQLQKDVKQYLKEIDKLLPGSKKERKTFLKEYQKSICASIKESGQIYDYEQLVSCFGSPGTIAADFEWTWNKELCVRAESQRHKRFWISCVLTLIFILCVIWLSYVLVDAFVNYNNSCIIQSGVLY